MVRICYHYCGFVCSWVCRYISTFVLVNGGQRDTLGVNPQLLSTPWVSTLRYYLPLGCQASDTIYPLGVNPQVLSIHSVLTLGYCLLLECQHSGIIYPLGVSLQALSIFFFLRQDLSLAWDLPHGLHSCSVKAKDWVSNGPALGWQLCATIPLFIVSLGLELSFSGLRSKCITHCDAPLAHELFTVAMFLCFRAIHRHCLHSTVNRWGFHVRVKTGRQCLWSPCGSGQRKCFVL